MKSTRGLTSTSYLVLGLLRWLGPSTPYDLKKAVEGSVGNFWSFPHSQLYAEPQRLTQAGLVREEREQTGRRRRVFSITRAGTKALSEWLADPTVDGWELRDLGLLKLFFGSLGRPEDVVGLARGQEHAHRARLRDYESLEGRLREATGIESQRATLRMGLIYERAAVRFWRDIAEEFQAPSR